MTIRVRSQLAVEALVENPVVFDVVLVTNGDNADVVVYVNCAELPLPPSGW